MYTTAWHVCTSSNAINREGNSYEALNYFRKSFHIIHNATNIDPLNTATVLLNISILYSKISNHSKAMETAKESIQRILRIINKKQLTESTIESENSKPNETMIKENDDSKMPPLFLTNVDIEINSKEDSKSIELINLLYLAYYNCGIESNSIGKLDKAIKLMEVAVSIHSFLSKACSSTESDAFSKVCNEKLNQMKDKLIRKKGKVATHPIISHQTIKSIRALPKVWIEKLKETYKIAKHKIEQRSFPKLTTYNITLGNTKNHNTQVRQIEKRKIEHYSVLPRKKHIKAIELLTPLDIVSSYRLQYKHHL